MVASFDGGALTLWTSTQAPHHVRDQAADALGLALRPVRVRVIGCDVGGGFGGKEHLYPDEALVCLAAVRFGVPVKWIESPRDHLTATLPARDAVHRGRLALDARDASSHCTATSSAISGRIPPTSASPRSPCRR